MTDQGLKISIVIPVYNSEKVLLALMDRINKSMAGFNWDITFVDDGSKDGSWSSLESISSSFSNVRIISLTKNFGQHNALLCGLNFATGEVVITMDDDLQHPPEEIPKLINNYLRTKADVVYGEYQISKASIVSKTGSYLYSRSSDVSFDKLGRGSSFRLLKGSLVQEMRKHHQQNFIFIDEIISWYTTRVEFVPVEHHARFSGVSGYSPKKRFFLFFKILVNYSAKPLKLMIYGGLIGSLLMLLIAGYFIVKKVFFSINVPGFTALIVAVLFSTSLMLFCFGIVGQYIYRILQFQNNRPPYSIRKMN